jgi:quercetin dioxygenase-like cupin family protein
MMSNVFTKRALAGMITAILLTSSASFVEAQAGVQRKILLQQDLDISGHETLLVDVSLAVGAREGRHTHAGTLVIHVLEGELTLEQEGLPARTFKAGESGIVKPGQVHEGINHGKIPVKVLATFIAEKGKPLTTQVR